MTYTFDYPLDPIDKQTRVATSGGFSYDETIRPGQEIVYPYPPLTRKFCRLKGIKRDFTGKKFGRFVVIGLYKEKPKWVVKCSCGYYALRSHKAVSKAAQIDACCAQCRHVNHLRHKAALSK